MKKRIGIAVGALIVLCAALLVFLPRLRAPDTPPELSIQADGREIAWTVGKDKWNGVAYDREDTLQACAAQIRDLPELAPRSAVTITFQGTPPDAVRLTEAVVQKSGVRKYDYRLDTELALECSENKASFTLKRNSAALLSSDTADYAPGALCQGYRLFCQWGDNSCEYGFLIRVGAENTPA